MNGANKTASQTSTSRFQYDDVYTPEESEYEARVAWQRKIEKCLTDKKPYATIIREMANWRLYDTTDKN